MIAKRENLRYYPAQVMHQVDGSTRLRLENPIPQPLLSSAARSVCLALTLSVSGGGCVHLYQPMSGLHEPVVVDIRAENLPGLNMVIHCVPGEMLNSQESAQLCQNIGILFENQGASVRTITSRRQLQEDLFDATASEEDDTPQTDLFVELRARQIHESNDPLMWALCAVSFTLIPSIQESTFAQDVIVRDGTGFLLLQDTLQGRIIRRFGAGVWAVNQALNVTIRKEPDRITEDSVRMDLSNDLYSQLSQMVFNARVQRDVLLESEQEGSSWK